MRGCGRRETVGHGEVAICGQPYWGLCDGCKLKQAKELLQEAAAEMRGVRQFTGLVAEIDKYLEGRS